MPRSGPAPCSRAAEKTSYLFWLVAGRPDAHLNLARTGRRRVRQLASHAIVLIAHLLSFSGAVLAHCGD